MSARPHPASKPKSSEAVALFAYALTGAAMATLVLAVVEMVHSSPSPGMGAPASSSSSSVQRACPLSASPEPCDNCMLASCLPSCLACAENPSCLRLFACLMDCTDPACERTCAEQELEGKRDLNAFLGESGCLVQRCSAVCP